jgi:hypothetical protein
LPWSLHGCGFGQLVFSQQHLAQRAVSRYNRPSSKPIKENRMYREVRETLDTLQNKLEELRRYL